MPATRIDFHRKPATRSRRRSLLGSRRSILRSRTSMLAALALGGLGGLSGAMASAAARPERLTITVPAHARVSTPTHRRLYTVIVRGFSAQRARLLVFLDYELCSSSLATERLHGVSPVSFHVSGGFRRRSLWESGVRGTDHVCAY